MTKHVQSLALMLVSQLRFESGKLGMRNNSSTSSKLAMDNGIQVVHRPKKILGGLRLLAAKGYNIQNCEISTIPVLLSLAATLPSICSKLTLTMFFCMMTLRNGK